MQQRTAPEPPLAWSRRPWWCPRLEGEVMRVFSPSWATEINTFSPIPTDLSSFKEGFYCPPGTHPEKPRLFSAPLVMARRRAEAGGFTLIEGTCTSTQPAGMVSRDAYETLRD